jgi:hypothetical protein
MRRVIAIIFATAVLSACTTTTTSIPTPSEPRTSASHAAAARHPRKAIYFSRSYLAAHPKVIARLRHPHVTNVPYGGGPVQVSPVIYLVFFGIASPTDTAHDPYGEASYLTNFYTAIGSSTWINDDTQYYMQSGGTTSYITNPSVQYGGSYYDPTLPASTTLTDNMLYAETLKAVGVFGYNFNANYVIVTPTGYTQSGYGTQFCAYHSWAYDGQNETPFTFMPYQPDQGPNCGAGSVTNPGTLDGASITGGHEAAETQTDPDTSTGWVDPSDPNNIVEIGDKCAWITPGQPGGLQVTAFPDGQSFPTQSLWSNATSSCVQSYGTVVVPTPTPSPTPGNGNVIQNPGFETGSLSPWTSCRSSIKIPTAETSTVGPHSGTYDAYAGTFKNHLEPAGTSSVCQLVTIPSSAVLTTWTLGISNDRNHNVYQFIGLFKKNGSIDKVLYSANVSNTSWKSHTFNLAAYAGHQDYLALGVVGRKSAPKGKYVGLYVDDVTLSGATAQMQQPAATNDATPFITLGPP